MLRSALFAIARAIDVDGDQVAFVDWRKPKATREAIITLRENAVLNLFLGGRELETACEASGLDRETFNAAVESLRRKGLLLSLDEWQAERAKYGYVNLPSLWQDMPTDVKPFASYEDAYANDFAPWNQLPVAADVLSMAPLPETGRRLLDVGCGSGHNLDLMQSLGFDIWGIDISATAIARVQEKAVSPDRFVAGSVTALPWDDASFDLVTDIGCLHCLQPEEVDAYIREVARVLAPGGRFLCRSFKPRDEKVLAAQPVKMDRLGYAPNEVEAMFAPVLPVDLVKEGPVHCFYLAQRAV